MQLTIHAQGDGADVLSFLLAKHPERQYERAKRIRFASFIKNLLKTMSNVVPDSLSLVKDPSEKLDITHYINDREFAVSRLFLSLIRSPLATALNGLPNK